MHEPESTALRTWLEDDGSALTGSELLTTEALRACRRVDAAAVPLARAALRRVGLIGLTRELLEDAGTLDPPLLRSLDAIHLASALSIRDDVSALITYDARLAEAASAAGLAVVAPSP